MKVSQQHMMEKALSPHDVLIADSLQTCRRILGVLVADAPQTDAAHARQPDILVVRVVAADAAPSQSTAQISDSVFGTNGDSVNLRSQYSACSQGQLTMLP